MFSKYLNKEHTILFKLIISYLTILIIPVFLGSIIYVQVIKISTDNAHKFNLSVLEQARDLLDARLSEIDGMARQLERDTKVLSVINSGAFGKNSSNYYKIWEAFTSIPKFKETNTFVNDQYLFFRNNSAILSGSTVYDDGEYFFNNSLRFFGMDYNEWNKLIWSKYFNGEYLSSNSVIIESEESKAIYYLRSILNNYTFKPEGMIVILIKDESLRSLINRVDIGNEGMVFISDGDKKIVLSIAGEKSRFTPSEAVNAISGVNIENKTKILKIKNSKNMIFSKISSSFNNWSYISVVPVNQVMTEVNYIKSIIYISVIIVLLIGFGISYLFAVRNIKPVNEIISILRNKLGLDIQNSGNEYEYINKAIAQIMDDNNYLSSNIQYQKPIIQDFLLKRMLNGENINQNEFDKFCSYLQINFEGKQYVVLVMSLGKDTIESNKEEIKSIIKNCSINNENHELKFFINPIDKDTLAILLIYNYEERMIATESINEFIHKLYSEIENIYIPKAVFAVGNIYNSIENVSLSYDEAMQALKYNLYIKNGIAVWYEEIPKDSGYYYYPIDLELRIISLVKSGNVEVIKSTLNKLYLENFEYRSLSSKMAEQLVLSMKNTLIRSIEQIGTNNNLEDILLPIEEVETIDILFNRIIRGFLSLCEISYIEEKKKENQLKENIIQYVDKYYSRYDLTIEVLASDFNISEASMNQIVKSNLGCSFSKYLENIRIQKACEFLIKKEIPIKEIAEFVGYSSDNSFRRAFKRLMGITPSEYAETVK